MASVASLRHLADDAVNQLRRVAWQVTRIRLAQIDGEQALRQVRLYPEGNTRLPPGEYSQNRHGSGGPPVHQENPPHPPLPKGGILVVDDFLSQ